MSDDNFLSRWSRRKTELKSGLDPDRRASDVLDPASGAGDRAGARPAMPADAGLVPGDESTVVGPPPAGAATPVEPPPPPPPTLADVALLTPEDSYARFVAPGVDPAVRNAAMKKLFTDPHYNVMDGLDIYIDDYGKPDPIPPAMLRLMTQSKSLGLFDHEDAGQDELERRRAATEAGVDAAPVPAAEAADSHLPPAAEARPDEDPDLQLQPDDGARRAGAGPGADQPAQS